MAVGTHLAVLGVLTLAVPGYVLIRRRWAVIVTVAGAALISLLAAGVLKSVLARPRPPADTALVHAAGFSMPSTDGAVTPLLQWHCSWQHTGQRESQTARHRTAGIELSDDR